MNNLKTAITRSVSDEYRQGNSQDKMAKICPTNSLGADSVCRELEGVKPLPLVEIYDLVYPNRVKDEHGLSSWYRMPLLGFSKEYL